MVQAWVLQKHRERERENGDDTPRQDCLLIVHTYSVWEGHKLERQYLVTALFPALTHTGPISAEKQQDVVE